MHAVIWLLLLLALGWVGYRLIFDDDESAD